MTVDVYFALIACEVSEVYSRSFPLFHSNGKKRSGRYFVRGACSEQDFQQVPLNSLPLR